MFRRDEFRWFVTDRQHLEVRLATFDLGAFSVQQLVQEEAALGLRHEVEPLRTILFDQHGPSGLKVPSGVGTLNQEGSLAYTFTASFFSNWKAKVRSTPDES